MLVDSIQVRQPREDPGPVVRSPRVSTGSVRLCAGLLVLAACGGEAPPPRPVAAAPRPRSTTASRAPVSAPDAAPDQLLPLEPPASLADGDRREAFRVLSTLCEVSLTKGEPQVGVGCSCCAPFAECPPHVGMVAEPNESTNAVDAIAFGSFTAAGRDEVALSMNGCEPHSGNYGGTVVAARQGAGWKLVRYESGLHPRKMRSYRRSDGHDVLVCEWTNAHQTATTSIFVRDLTVADDKFDDLFSVWDNTTISCTGVPPGSLISWGTIDDWSLADVDGDGALDVHVDAQVSRGPLTPRYTKLCDGLFGDPPKEVHLLDALPPPRRLSLDFLARGAAFVPSPATTRQLRR